uniref:DNA ligase 4 n=1 Tax=Hirondellea gigas TaxID=1518452 RepID=A0A2P2I750_9CRUS
MSSISSRVPWSQLCRLLDKVKNGKRSGKKELLSNFMQSYRDMLEKHRQLNPNDEDSFFPAMRVLLPALDKNRGAYGVKEKKLADLYIKILGIKKDSPDALKLINYRKPKTAGGSVAGDFAEVAYYVLKNRCPAEGHLTLNDVDTYLTTIAADHAAKDNEGVTSTMLVMLRSMSATEQKWLVRVLLKDMQLGIGQTAIFAAWHPDSRDYYDVNNNLMKVCSTLRDPSVRLHEIEVSLFSPFRPMLAERAVLENIESQMQNKTYVAENKFDGERSQIHKQGDKYMYFSRNGFDFTSNFGGSPKEGLLTPHLHGLLAPHVNEMILDGEVVCWHKTHNVVVNKGEHFDVKNLRDDGPLQVCFCAFDLLLLNGRVLTNLPLSARVELLKTVIRESPGRVLVSQQEQVNDKADVVRCLNAAIDRRDEGLVLKDPDSVYRPAARTKGWIKVKPDYVDSLVPELDLVIVGGFYGAGRQHGVISHFLLAAAHSDTITDGGRVTRVVSVCRVGSGYTSDELAALGAKLAPCLSKVRPSTVVECSKDKPHVWYNPSNSVVLQIRAAEVSTTKSYGSNHTLRFPRVEAIRADKTWQDILTTAQLEQLRQEASGKLAVHHLPEDSDGVGSGKKGVVQGAQLTTRGAALPLHFTPADLSSVTQTGSALAGKEVCVLDGAGAGHTKQQLERMVAEAGGSVTQNPGSDTFCVVCSKSTVRSKNLSKGHNIVKPEWLVRSIESKELLPWGPLDAISLLPDKQLEASYTHDRHGDSYTRHVDVARLQTILDNMQAEQVADVDLQEMQEDLMEFDEPYHIFSRVTALMVDEDGRPTADGEMTRLQLQLYGAATVISLTSAVTHLVCRSSDCSLSWEQREGRHLVTEAWVEDTIRQGKRLNERTYTPSIKS